MRCRSARSRSCWRSRSWRSALSDSVSKDPAAPVFQACIQPPDTLASRGEPLTGVSASIAGHDAPTTTLTPPPISAAVPVTSGGVPGRCVRIAYSIKPARTTLPPHLVVLRSIPEIVDFVDHSFHIRMTRSLRHALASPRNMKKCLPGPGRRWTAERPCHPGSFLQAPHSEARIRDRREKRPRSWCTGGNARLISGHSVGRLPLFLASRRRATSRPLPAGVGSCPFDAGTRFFWGRWSGITLVGYPSTTR